MYLLLQHQVGGLGQDLEPIIDRHLRGQPTDVVRLVLRHGLRLVRGFLVVAARHKLPVIDVAVRQSQEVLGGVLGIADYVNVLARPPQGQDQKPKIAVPRHENKGVDMIVDPEDLEGIRDENHVGAVFSAFRDVDQVEVPSGQRRRQLAENDVVPVAVSPRGHNPALGLGVLYEAFEKE